MPHIYTEGKGTQGIDLSHGMDFWMTYKTSQAFLNVQVNSVKP